MSTSIDSVQFTEALEERYLSYALSTIMARSLPDVRDGLKPVHRRLIYAMLQLKLDPKSGFKKCARVVGDVVGKYHPHSEQAVYDALTRLAQDFIVRYPLIEGQGNFGSIDGDNPAAMRYTESKLTHAAMALLGDIDKNTVPFRATYDGSESEPMVLPAAFPNVLANGAEGIAVGMASSIPPHNISELCDAMLHMIENPKATTEELLTFLPGPDFPTGGIVVEDKGTIQRAYETGKGSFRMRARWEKEPLAHGMYQIVITEIPYQVKKSKLIEKIAELFKEKRLALLGNIRDESAEDIRIVLEPKSRTCDPEMLMESLFKLTDLEVRFSMNMNVLTEKSVPKVMGLAEVLTSFLDHRKTVVVRRSEHRLAQIERRLEILSGFLIVYVHLDEVIRIIREEDHPKEVMMKKWGLTELQVDAILNLRLRSLQRLEEIAIRKEHDELSKEKDVLEKLLASERRQWTVIRKETEAIKKHFTEDPALGERRTAFDHSVDANKVIDIEAFIEREPVTIICSKKGWIRGMKGHGHDVSTFKYKDGDEEGFVETAMTTDKLLLFTSSGRCFTVPCDKVPKGKGFGEPISVHTDLEENDTLVALHVFKADQLFCVAGTSGKGFIVSANDMVAQTRNGRQVLSLTKGSKALLCKPVKGDMVATVGTNRKLLVMPMDELPVMKRGQGVQIQRYKDATLADITFFTKDEGLTWQIGDRTRSEKDMTAWLGKRGLAGKLVPPGFPRSNKF